MANIGFIGIGVMGRSMAENLVKKGHNLYLYNRSMDKSIKAAKEIGANVASSIKEVVKDKDFVISIIGYPKDVEEVYLGRDGILNYANSGTIAIDMTTSSPTLAKVIYERGKQKGISCLDAPVSGGDTGAKNATLSIMVGGEKEAFDKAKDIFSAMGTSINYMGKSGNGQHTKACNQIVVAANTVAYTESLVYAKENGLDQDLMLKAISGGAAGSWQVSNMAPRVRRGDFDPGFFIKHFIKDMKIIKEEMKDKNIELVALNKVLEMYKDLEKKGYENYGTQSLIKYYDKNL